MGFSLKNWLFLAIVLLSTTSFAQRNSGIKIGLNYSWIATDITSNPLFYNDYELEPTLTYHFGYSWNIKVADKWSVQTDLIYNWKGSISKYKNPNDPKWTNENGYANPYENPGGFDKVQYLSLPITLSYMITPHFFAEFGGELSVNPLGSTASVMQFGLAAGAVYSTNYVDISLRYTHDLTSNSIIYGSVDSPYYSKYRTFQLSFTIPVFKYLKRK